MNDLYGIDPRAPGNLRDLSELMKIFGPSEGRFIADFPMEWSKTLHLHMKQLSDIGQYATVEAWVRFGRHALLPVNARFKESLTWQENALSIKDEVVKLVGPAGRPKNIVQPIDELLLDPNGFRDSRGDHIPRTADAYVMAIRPIILSSPKLVLVDPYFRLHYKDRNSDIWRPDKRVRFVKSLLKSAAQGRQIECFEIFIDPSKTPDRSVCLDDLRRIASDAGADKIELQIRHLDRKFPLEQHARYALGMSSGLHFDHGFDISDDGSTNHVEWISRSALRPLLDRFT